MNIPKLPIRSLRLSKPPSRSPKAADFGETARFTCWFSPLRDGFGLVMKKNVLYPSFTSFERLDDTRDRVCLNSESNPLCGTKLVSNGVATNLS